MAADTKAVARWDWDVSGMSDCYIGDYVRINDHEQVVAEWTRLAHEARRNALSAEAKNAELRSALAAKSVEVEGLKNMIRVMQNNQEFDFDAAMEKSNEHQDQ